MVKIYSRRKIREKVLQVLYAYELNNEGIQRHIDEIFANVKNNADKDFGLNLIFKTIANRNLIDKLIENKTSNWELERIAVIDKILLRMGICEFLYFEDIPPKVSINEIIEISKVFSTESSGKFLNGVLDAILNEIKISGQFKKTGRGLIDNSLTTFSENTDAEKKL